MAILVGMAAVEGLCAPVEAGLRLEQIEHLQAMLPADSADCRGIIDKAVAQIIRRVGVVLACVAPGRPLSLIHI